MGNIQICILLLISQFTLFNVNYHREEYLLIYYNFYMLLTLLLMVPLIGIFLISTSYNNNSILNLKQVKVIGLSTSIVNLFISMIVFILFNFRVINSNLYRNIIA